MPDVAEFLEARIAEDEAALDAVPSAAKQLDDFDFGGTDDYLRFTMGYGRAVAECAAKRAIIEQAGEASIDRSQVIGEFCVGQEERDREYATDPGLLILRTLATVYKDHPDYQQEWS